jgi:hypothetical protein
MAVKSCGKAVRAKKSCPAGCGTGVLCEKVRTSRGERHERSGLVLPKPAAGNGEIKPSLVFRRAGTFL